MHQELCAHDGGAAGGGDGHPEQPPDRLARIIGGKALEAMLFEVSATPKPGLVDRGNGGAHYDMDFFTFMSSAASLRTAFDEFARIGLAMRAAPPEHVFRVLRQCGRQAESAMFAGTGGINTHKGMIFSLGLVCGATGWNWGKRPFSVDVMGGAVARMCAGLCGDAFRDLRRKAALTKGEGVFLAHGFTGARGEAESGFATVRTVSYPVLCELRERGLGINEVLTHTLLHLIAETIDTNIVSRHDLKTAVYAREKARHALHQGGMLTNRGLLAVREMDSDFIEKHISPGGCADLLAVTYLVHELEFALTGAHSRTSPGYSSRALQSWRPSGRHSR